MRLDVFLFSNGYTKSREEAQKLIRTGNVTLNGIAVTKPSFQVETDDADIVVKNPFLYVSRGGDKLHAALEAFNIDPNGLICADIGASTGGFTDCLLKHGARVVYAIDSGTNQLVESLKNDPRVFSMENVNARYLSKSDIGQTCTLCVMDVSFISQSLLYGAVADILPYEGTFISLIKPQFEAGRENISKGGIVKNEKVHQQVIEKLIHAASAHGLIYQSHIISPIKGGDGNIEYLALFKKS